MTIVPIWKRELTVAARRARLHSERSYFAGILLIIVMGTFAARYYWDMGPISPQWMERVWLQSFGWAVAAHAMLIMGVVPRAAVSIAGEKDRRTLDFLLGTRLGNAEIVLGKFAACLTSFLSTIAAGLPVMLLFFTIGGIDFRLILLIYGSLACAAVFLVALSVWASTAAVDSGSAVRLSVSCMLTWLVGPFVVAFGLPRLGVRLPGFILTANAWLLASSPLGLMSKIGGGIALSGGLIDAVALMGGLQLLWGTLLLTWAIVRLRSAYRVNVSDDGRGLANRLTRPGWRLRAKPPVSDDPILWREMTTSREDLVSWTIGWIFILCIYASLSYATYFFGRPAFVEVWRHGYTAGMTTAERPEWNLMIRVFLPDHGVNPPADIARTEFNVFLRFVTVPMMFFVPMMASGIAAAGIASERARETWSSLIATPLTAREILWGKILAALWRMRWVLSTLLALWSIGLIAGSIHPLGYLAILLELAASTWLMLACGTLASVHAKDLASATGQSGWLAISLAFSSAVVFLLPARWSSVVLGAGSPPFVGYLTLVSYRDVRAALCIPAYPPLQWIGINTGEGALAIAAAFVIAIVAAAVGGLCYWRYAHAQFDRLIGRPWRHS